MVEEIDVEFVRAVYPYKGGDQAVPLPFAESTILQVVEKTQEGWCRGFAAGKEGWFPITYVKPLGNGELLQKGIQPSSLAALMRSDLWNAHITSDNKIYYVNTENKGTTWELPVVGVPVSPTTGIPDNQQTTIPATQSKQLSLPRTKPQQKSKKPKQIVINGITYVEHGEEQPRLDPGEVSYVDHFWADQGDQSGFDVILAKHLNGKECMKDMIDFFRERAALEEQYAKGLLKLSKSTLADQEEGTLGKAWQALKAELRHRAESHMKFVEKLQKDMEKSLFDYKESQKKIRKQHQQVMEKSRKQVATMDASIDKAFGVAAGKGKLKRGVSTEVQPQPRRKPSMSGEDIKKLQETYNKTQQNWMDNMINACQDFERHEAERSDYLQEHMLKYIDLCVEVDEASAESLSLVTDSIDRINAKADKEFFIRRNGTGIKRPVDRTIEAL